MNIEEQIKNLILSEYKSILSFTKSINIPYSTVDTMLKNGIGGGSVTTVIKICTALGITADGIARGIIERAPDLSIIPTACEIEMIKKYRSLDVRGKETVNRAIDEQASYISDSSAIIAEDIANTIKVMGADLNQRVGNEKK